jgi:dicarboxylate transporter 10
MSALKTQRSSPEVRKSEDVVNKAVHYPFWFGGSASCCATLFTHPLDLGEPSLLNMEAWS